MTVLTIERKVLEKNDEFATQNRQLFENHGILCLNLVSSPGSGKTSLLEHMLGHMRTTVSVAVIEGDVQTDLDAQRVAAFDVPVVQIVTNGGCHLDAKLVQEAASKLPLDGVQLLIIENVGNLVCPANYDLGESMKIVVASITEGEDKPLKYPAMFRKASILVINKMDLAPYVNCNPAVLKQHALSVNPRLRVFETSCTTNVGISELCQWITKEVAVW